MGDVEFARLLAGQHVHHVCRGGWAELDQIVGQGAASRAAESDLDGKHQPLLEGLERRAAGRQWPGSPSPARARPERERGTQVLQPMRVRHDEPFVPRAKRTRAGDGIRTHDFQLGKLALYH
jgi:hypothetical protein